MILKWLTPSLILCWAFSPPLWAESGPPPSVSLQKNYVNPSVFAGAGGVASPQVGPPGLAHRPEGSAGVCFAPMARRVLTVFLGFPQALRKGSPCPAEHPAVPEPPGPAAAERPIEIYENEAVRSYLRNYLETSRHAFERGMVRSEHYLGMIRTIFARQGVPQELAYLAAVESNFNFRARSRAHAVGLWQFMYHTGRKFGLRIAYPWYDERLDPEYSTRAAARLLAYLHDVYNSWELALAAYNAGEGRVNQALRQARRAGAEADFWNLDLPTQTQEYVPAFFAATLLYTSMRAAVELIPTAQPAPRVTDTLEVNFSISLAEVAHRLELPLTELVSLNPAWRRGRLPSGLKGGATLRLPLGLKNALLASLQGVPETPIPWLTHRVEVGETLDRIARGYGITIAEILSVNPIPDRHFLAIGQRLIIPLPPGGRKPDGEVSELPTVGAWTPRAPNVPTARQKAQLDLLAER